MLTEAAELNQNILYFVRSKTLLFHRFTFMALEYQCSVQRLCSNNFVIKSSLDLCFFSTQLLLAL